MTETGEERSVEWVTCLRLNPAHDGVHEKRDSCKAPSPASAIAAGPVCPAMGTIYAMDRKCGIKGCVWDALPGAYVEVLASLGTGFEHVRVEVCRPHYEVLIEPLPMEEAKCS